MPDEGRPSPDGARPESGDVTMILNRAAEGDSAAVEQLFPVVYDELRALADRYLRQERPDHTLQPTALVHEAYLRMVQPAPSQMDNRTHFFAIAARAMRHILVNHAKARGRLKRGGDRERIDIDPGEHAAVADDGVDLLELDAALDSLARHDADKARLVELRYFGGLTIEETARLMGTSERSVRRAWTFAKAWLRAEIGRLDGDIV